MYACPWCGRDAIEGNQFCGGCGHELPATTAPPQQAGRARIVATFGPTTGWAGKTIAYENQQLVLEGHGPIRAEGVLEYDRQGHLVWANAGLREWVQGMVASRQAAPAAPPTTHDERTQASQSSDPVGAPAQSVPVHAVPGTASVSVQHLTPSGSPVVAKPNEGVVVANDIAMKLEAARCEECGCDVYVRPDGCCLAGHPRESLSAVRSVSSSPPLAALCEQCKKVVVIADGTCPNGHEADSLRSRFHISTPIPKRRCEFSGSEYYAIPVFEHIRRMTKEQRRDAEVPLEVGTWGGRWVNMLQSSRDRTGMAFEAKQIAVDFTFGLRVGTINHPLLFDYRSLVVKAFEQDLPVRSTSQAVATGTVFAGGGAILGAALSDALAKWTVIKDAPFLALGHLDEVAGPLWVVLATKGRTKHTPQSLAEIIEAHRAWVLRDLAALRA